MSVERFDKYTALLRTPPKDHRLRLVFDELIENARTRTAGIASAVSETTVGFDTPIYLSNTTNYVAGSEGASDSIVAGLSNEYIHLIRDVALRCAGKALTPENKLALQNLLALTSSFEDRVAGTFIKSLVDTTGNAFLTNAPGGLLFTNMFSNMLGARGGDRTPAAESGKTFFNVALGKYYIGLALERAAASATLPVSPELLAEEPVPSADEPTYVRNTNGELCLVKDGKLIPVGKGSDLFNSVIKSDPASTKCLYTGLKDGTDVSGRYPRTCADYFRDCLSGTGKDSVARINKCKLYLKSPSFWGDAAEEVKNMLPAIAVQTLNSFGFKVLVSNGVKHFESWDQWMAGLGALGLSQDEIGHIARNTKLQLYVQALIKKVNGNPDILNPGKAAAAVGATNPNSYFARFGLRPRPPTVRTAGNVMSMADAGRLHQTLAGLTVRIGTNFNRPVVVPLTMAGGASSVLADLEQMKSTEAKHTSHLFQQVYSSFVARLNSMGKSVSEADNNKINQLISSLKAAEQKLFRIMVVTERYATLLQVHGERDPSSSLTYSDLKKFVDARSKYFDRTVRKQDALLNILSAIQQAVRDASTGASTGAATGAATASAPAAASASSIDWATLLK